MSNARAEKAVIAWSNVYSNDHGSTGASVKSPRAKSKSQTNFNSCGNLLMSAGLRSFQTPVTQREPPQDYLLTSLDRFQDKQGQGLRKSNRLTQSVRSAKNVKAADLSGRRSPRKKGHKDLFQLNQESMLGSSNELFLKYRR